MRLPSQSAALVGLAFVICLTGHALVGSAPAVPTNQWAPGPALNEPRSQASATALGDGQTIVAGGRGAAGPLSSVELLASGGAAVPAAPMAVARAGHAAASLGGGRVLVAGGTTVVTTDEGSVEIATASAELFDSASGAWVPVGSLTRARSGATAVALPDGRVAIVGGRDAAGAVIEVEVFDPVAGGFVAGGALSSPRDGAAVAVTREGTIVVAGGSVEGVAQATADVIDPVTGVVAAVSLSAPRAGASATTTVDNRVLVIGGSDGATALATSELLDAATGVSVAGPSLSTAREGHAAYLLPQNGGVLVVGGVTAGGLAADAEVVIPWAGAVQATPAVPEPRTATAGAAGPAEGVFAVAGGRNAAGTPSAATDYYGYATIRTDKDDYAPGEFVTITGTGWQPGETVDLLLHEVGTGAPDTPLNAVADEHGNILNDFWAPNESHLGVRFYLTATGAGATAQTTFTDNISVQAATVELRNAACSSAQSTFAPGDTICARIVVTATNGSGAGNSFFIQWVSPSAGLTTPPSTTETAPATAPTTFDRTFATTAATPTGLWTVRVCRNNNNPCSTGNTFDAATFTLAASNATISGTVYNDANGNGAFDVGEVGIGGVTVTRDGTGTTTTTTAANGLYTFSGLAAGTYSVDYAVPAGLANTGVKPRSVTVAAGAASTGNDFFAAPAYTVRFDQVGMSADTGTATVVTVNGTPYTRADLPKELSFTAGASVTYSYATPVASTVTGKRYALTTPAPSPASPFTVSGAVTVTGTYKAQYQVVFTQAGIGADSTGTVVTVDGGAKTAAQLAFTTDWLDSGTVVTYDFAATVASTVAGKRYTLTTPAPTPVSPITVDGPATVAGTYSTEYQLTFAQSGLAGDATGTVVTIDGDAKALADLPFTAWFTSGASVSYAFADPVSSSVSGKRYALTTPAPSPASPIAVSAPATVTGTYKVQFAVTFTQVGIGGDSTGTVVTVGAAPKTAGDLPFTGWFDDGSPATYVFADPVASSVSGKRYALTIPAATPASPFTVSGPVTVTGTYKTQFQVTFAQSGLGADTTATVVTVDASPKTAADLPFTTDWVDDGGAVTYLYATPVASTLTGKRYVLTTPDPSPASPITVAAPTTVTGTYKTQFLLTFAQSGIGVDSTGTVVTVEGTPKTAADLPDAQWFDQGASVSYAFSDPVASTVAGKRYALTTPAPAPGSPITVSGPATVTGTYKVQFQWTFAQTGIGGDSTGTVVTIAGAPLAAAALPFSDWFDQGTSISYAYASPVATTVTGKRYVLTLPYPTPASPAAVSGPAAVTGTYKTQFQLTFAQTGILPGDTGGNTVVQVDGSTKALGDLPFQAWYDENASVSYAFSSPISTVPVSARQYELTNAGSLPASPITVTGPLTVTGIYTVNTYTIRYLQPLDQSTASNFVVNTGKNGRVIPVKVEIFRNGTELDAGTFLMRVGGSNCAAGAPTDLVTEYADAGSSNGNTNVFRLADGFWIYNLETSPLKLANNSCYRLDVYMNAYTGSTAVLVSSSTWAIFKPVK